MPTTNSENLPATHTTIIGYRNNSDPDVIVQNATIAIANTAPIIAVFVFGNNDTLPEGLMKQLKELKQQSN